MHHGLTPLDKFARPLNLSQTTPPSGPLGTASQVLFDPQSTALYLTVKSKPGTTTTGFLAQYLISKTTGNVGRTPFMSKSDLPGPNINFGAAFVNDSMFVIADPGIGAHFVIVSLTGSERFNEVGGSNLTTTSAAICWAAYSPLTKTVFLTDGGKGQLSESSPTLTLGPPYPDGFTGRVIRVYTPPGNFSYFLDMAVRGKYLYALAPGNATIAVFNISGGPGTAELLSAAPTGKPVKVSSTGLATFPIV